MSFVLQNKLTHIIEFNKEINKQYNDFELNLYNSILNIRYIEYLLMLEGVHMKVSIIRDIYNMRTPSSVNYEDFILCNNICLGLRFLYSLKHNKLSLDANKIIKLYYLLCTTHVGEFRDISLRDKLEEVVKNCYELANPVESASYIHCSVLYLEPFTNMNKLLAIMCESYFLIFNNFPITYCLKSTVPVYKDIFNRVKTNFDYSFNNYTSLLVDNLNEQLLDLNAYRFPERANQYRREK